MLQNPLPNLPPHTVLYLFHASSRAAQVHAQEDDYDEQVEGEHDPVDGLRDEAPAGRVDFLVARDVVGAGDVHGLHVDGVTASGWELRERRGAHFRDNLCHKVQDDPSSQDLQRWTLLWTLGCEKFLPGLAWLLLSKTGPLFSPSL